MPVGVAPIRRRARHLEGYDEAPQSGEHPLIAFAQEGGEDVLADLLAPEVVAAIAPGQLGAEQVHPMGLKAAGNPVAAGADAVPFELEAALEAPGIDGNSGKVDGRPGHGTLAREHPQI